MLTVAIPKRNKLQNIIVLTPKDGYCPRRYGNIQIFPKPTAEPTQASTKPSELLKLPFL